MTLTNIVKK